MNGFNIPQLDGSQDEIIQRRINQKTKPLGALGLLEDLAAQIARIQGCERLNISHPVMLVFAADHGIADYGVSIAPKEVTRQMVLNFASGGAAINVFSSQTGFELAVIDAGISQPIRANDGATMTIIDQSLGLGTQAFHLTSAMTAAEVEKGFALTQKLIEKYHNAGTNLIALGEMGIGNTSSASAIMAAILALDTQTCVGRGTGVDDQTLIHKTKLIQQGLDLHRSQLLSATDILIHLGGFEIVQMTAAILAAAEKQMLVVIDGFIATAAALVAEKIDSACLDYLIFAHESQESGHKLMLEHLNAEPLLHLGLRLGEGTGAALSLPIIQAAVNFYNDMASFDSAKVTDVS